MQYWKHVCAVFFICLCPASLLTRASSCFYSSNSHSPSPPSSSNAFSLLSSEQDNPSTSGCRSLLLTLYRIPSSPPSSSVWSWRGDITGESLSFWHTCLFLCHNQQQRTVSQSQDTEGALQDSQGAEDALTSRKEEQGQVQHRQHAQIRPAVYQAGERYDLLTCFILTVV